jgi:hypothetical protein
MELVVVPLLVPPAYVLVDKTLPDVPDLAQVVAPPLPAALLVVPAQVAEQVAELLVVALVVVALVVALVVVALVVALVVVALVVALVAELVEVARGVLAVVFAPPLPAVLLDVLVPHPAVLQDLAPLPPAPLQDPALVVFALLSPLPSLALVASLLKLHAAHETSRSFPVPVSHHLSRKLLVRMFV